MADVPGERLGQFAHVWRELDASPEVLQLVQQGHKIKFTKYPPKLSKPKMSFETRGLPSEMKVIRFEVKQLVKKGAIRVVPYEEAVKNKGFYSKLFCIPKPNSEKMRTIINLKPFNKYVEKHAFKMETGKDVRNLLQPQMYGAVVDLSDAYYHVKLHRTSWKYTRCILDGVIYEYVTLPMGLTCSPRLFTRVTKFFVAKLRKQGLLLVIYIE